jgi:hypothetical protein
MTFQIIKYNDERNQTREIRFRATYRDLDQLSDTERFNLELQLGVLEDIINELRGDK